MAMKGKTKQKRRQIISLNSGCHQTRAAPVLLSNRFTNLWSWHKFLVTPGGQSPRVAFHSPEMITRMLPSRVLGQDAS